MEGGETKERENILEV